MRSSIKRWLLWFFIFSIESSLRMFVDARDGVHNTHPLTLNTIKSSLAKQVKLLQNDIFRIDYLAKWSNDFSHFQWVE